MSILDRRHDGDTIRAWLGPVELDDEQMARFLQAWDAASDDDDDAILTTTVAYLLGDTTGPELGRQLLAARLAWESAKSRAAQYARLANADGITEVQLAAELGVDRARTLRRWLGK